MSGRESPTISRKSAPAPPQVSMDFIPSQDHPPLDDDGVLIASKDELLTESSETTILPGSEAGPSSPKPPPTPRMHTRTRSDSQSISALPLFARELSSEDGHTRTRSTSSLASIGRGRGKSLHSSGRESLTMSLDEVVPLLRQAESEAQAQRHGQAWGKEDGEGEEDEAVYGLSFEDRQAVALDAVKRKDVVVLRHLTLQPGGLGSHAVRRQAWPLLLGSEGSTALGSSSAQTAADAAPPDAGTGETVSNIMASPSASKEAASEGSVDAGTGVDPGQVTHKDERQVELDVQRSFYHFPKEVSPVEKERRRDQLREVIVTVLRRHGPFNYFQGYHDIVGIFVLCLDDVPLATQCAEALSLHRIRDSMGKNIDPIFGYLRIVRKIIEQEDPDFGIYGIHSTNRN